MIGFVIIIMASTNVWIQHVKKYQEAHPNLSWKECLAESKESYTPVPKVEKSGERKPNAWMEHIKAFKTATPDWKSKMSYKDVLVACKATYVKSEDKP